MLFWPSLRVVCFVLVMNLAISGDAQEIWQSYRITAGLDYSSGTFGQEKTTAITYLPVTAQAEYGAFIGKVTVPWIHVAGPAIILDGADGGVLGEREDDSNSGLGDVSVSLAYTVEQLYQYDVFLDFSARVKLPTASLRKGLGTGELDLALQADVAKAFKKVMPFATFGHKFVGVPEVFDLRNTFYGSVGIQYTWDEFTASGFVFDYRQSSVRSASDPQEMVGYINRRINDSWSLNVYGVVGFSVNSPSVGAGIMFTYRTQ